MKVNKILLGSAAVMALAIGYSSGAQAFDDVDWNWNKEVTSIENISIDVTDEFDLSGLAEIEKVQMNIGDVTASSVVDGINNSPPGTAEGIVQATFDTQIDLTAQYDDNAVNNPITGVTVNSPGLTGSNGAGNVDNNANEVNMTFDLNGEVDVDLANVEFSGEQDAIDLPSVESTATAVGNNQSIESTVAVNLHDSQFNMGDMSTGEMDDGMLVSAIGYLAGADIEGTGNTSTDILAIASLGAALDIVQQGQVSADSSVMNIQNASVDSSATAVGNNLSVDLAANIEGDAFALADITQFNYADVSASSLVENVTVDNYANMGALEGPLVKSAATAIGNNVSISVTSPSVD